ncbi:MAG TPA: kinase/pyrophosphorylase, partial [Verrucomicrobiae bacterium]|nr:kinase/pyrophosphorylase [Verrucomicrobiae bacterium]
MRHIYLLSDATGETVERVVKAALSQFRNIDIKLHRWNRLRTQQDIMRALDDALTNRGVVIYTLVDTELARVVRNQAEFYGLET